MVFFWEKWLRQKSYGWSIINILWSYSLIFILVSVVGASIFFSRKYGVGYFDDLVWNAYWNQNTIVVQTVNYFFWLLIVLMTLIGLLVNDKYGPGVFVSFILGRYFHPKREERIFMFLDIRGSTAIAERLGEIKYFNFLKDLFRDLTPGILDAKGEIYQYVGDEIVISWQRDVGVSKSNCIKCFQNIQQILASKTAYYQEQYQGAVPELKAGLHAGYVMVGELGIVKREIAYSGDVLNTTARIQSKCNEMGVNILLSKYLLDKIKSVPESFQLTPVGELNLRGKKQPVMLYTL